MNSSVTLVVLLLLATACASDPLADEAASDPVPAEGGSGPKGAASAEDPAGATTTWEIPGETVFPEGIAIAPDDSTFYVGSTADGAIYQGDVADPQAGMSVFLEPGADGRTTVTGLWVDGQARLFVAGRDSNRFFVYDTTDASLVADFTPPDVEETLLNDVVVAGDAAFVTDSFRPTLFRIPLDGDGVGEMEEWLDLDETPITYQDGFNLNGIVASEDGQTLLTVQYNTGELFRIDTASGEVSPVEVEGGPLETGDGLVLDETLLHVVLGGPGEIVTVQLNDELSSGEVVDRATSPEWLAPTTIAQADGQLLIVNSQLNMTSSPDQASLPFTVSAFEVPDGEGG